MPKLVKFFAVVLGTSVAATGLPAATPAKDKLVGVWLVRQEGAPFPMHMYVFGADGTVHQANPDAGNPRTSDSDGKGIWFHNGSKIVGKWVELSADRSTHQYIGRGELTFSLKLVGDRLTGISTFRSFDADGKANGGPFKVPFDGTRITYP